MTFRRFIFSSFLLGVVALPFSGCTGQPTEVELPRVTEVGEPPPQGQGAQRLDAPPVKLPDRN